LAIHNTSPRLADTEVVGGKTPTTAEKPQNYSLLFIKKRSLICSQRPFDDLGTHNSSSQRAAASWLVGRLSHGDGVVLPAEETEINGGKS
jgi:hypothetical protein